MGPNVAEISARLRPCPTHPKHRNPKGTPPRFLDPLRLVKAGPRTWDLLDALCYDSLVLGIRIIAPCNFTTDLASVPRLPFAFWLAGDTAQAPAVIHDLLYQRQAVTMLDGSERAVSRLEADAVFYEAMSVKQPELGHFTEPGWRRWAMWSQLRLWGWMAWRKRDARMTALNPIIARRHGWRS